MAVKVFYIVSEVEKALAFEWIVEAVNKSKFELHFILLGREETVLSRFLHQHGIPVYPIVLPARGGRVKAWWRVFRIMIREKPEVVHAHLYNANLIGISAAWMAGVEKRIYTRHFGSLHHVHFPGTVLVDKLINRMATQVIAPCRSIQTILTTWEGVPAKKVALINHGFKLNYFKGSKEDALEIRSKYKLLPTQSPVIGVIARYTEWKGIQYIIPAFKTLLTTYPQACLILANARGDYEAEIKRLLSGLPPGSFIQISFEPDLSALYALFDIFVHTPIDEFSEAFGQTYVEALAAGVPSVFTLSGVASDFIQAEKNALVVPYKDARSIYDAMIRLLTDRSLQENLTRAGREVVNRKFSLEKMMKELESLYAP